jgi:hypothetical protein
MKLENGSAAREHYTKQIVLGEGMMISTRDISEVAAPLQGPNGFPPYKSKPATNYS